MKITSIVVLSCSLGSAAGCDVINSRLLQPNDAPLGTDGAPPADAHPDAAPPDTYVPFEGNLVTNPDFEPPANSTGWMNNGGSTLAISTVQAHGGVDSLGVTARTSAWMGPAVQLWTKIRPGRQYTATIWGRLITVASDTLYVSTRHTCAETGSTQVFNYQNSRMPGAATNTGWVQVSSTFTADAPPHCTLTEFLVYVEATGTSDFYIDDIDVRELP